MTYCMQGLRKGKYMIQRNHRVLTDLARLTINKIEIKSLTVKLNFRYFWDNEIWIKYTHRKNGCLAASNLFHTFTQSFKFYTFDYHILKRCLKNLARQIDSKIKLVLHSASFTAKFGLVFVLALENTFLWRFHFKTNRKSRGSSKKRY